MSKPKQLSLPLTPVRPVSPSQISTFLECRRKWAWKHIAKIILPSHKSAQLGTETHAQLETYLEGGQFDFTTPAGYVAQSAVHLLPSPNAPGMELEKHFKFSTSMGHAYQGYIDLLAADSGIFPAMSGPTGTPAVSDHKTTGNLSYAKQPRDLHADPQAVIYAKFALDHFKTDKVDLVWTYMLTRGARKAKRTHLRVLRGNVEKEFAKIELVTKELVAIYSASPDPLTLPPTASACGNYGGCSFRHLCTDLSSINPQGKQMDQATADMFNGLSSRLPESERPPSDNVLPDWMTAEVDPIKKAVKGLVLPPPTVASTDLLDGLLGDTKASGIVHINPPGEDSGPEAGLLPPPVATVAPKKKTRRTNAQIAADKVAAEQPKPDTGYALFNISEPPTEPAPPLDAAPAFGPTPGWTLYIDCHPVNETYTSAESLFASAQTRIKGDTGAEDYRLIEYKGAGIFVACVNDIMDSHQGTDIVLDSRTPEGGLCLSSLSVRAARVVRGMR